MSRTKQERNAAVHPILRDFINSFSSTVFDAERSEELKREQLEEMRRDDAEAMREERKERNK